MSLLNLILLVASFQCSLQVYGAHLPPEIKTCKLNDPNLNECVRQSAQEAFNILKDGLPNLGVLPIDPLDIEKIDIPAGSGPITLSQIYTNVKLIGMAKCKYEKVNLNVVTLDMYSEVSIDYSQMVGDYEMDGRILVLPVKGKGKFNITLVNPRIYSNTTTEIFEHRGKQYLRVKTYDLKIEPEDTILQFDNLFGSDEKIAEQLNGFITTHQKELYNEMRQPFEDTFALIFKELANRIFSKIPLEEMFPDDKELFKVVPKN